MSLTRSISAATKLAVVSPPVKLGEAQFLDAASTLATLDSLPTLRTLLDRSAGVRESYSTREHESMVLRQFDQYPFAEALTRRSCILGPSGFRILLGFHDLAKVPENLSSGSSESMSKEAQHSRTAAVLETFKNSLPIESSQVKLMQSLVAADLLGPLVKGLMPEQVDIDDRIQFGRYLRDNWNPATYQKLTANFLEYARNSQVSEQRETELVHDLVKKVVTTANSLGLSPREYFYMQTVYYQCDSSSYTADATSEEKRGIAALDFLYKPNPALKNQSDQLFVFSESKGRLEFSEPYERVISRVERLLEQPEVTKALIY